ncbi:MAG: insulinase family protein [Sphingomonas sp.]|nr:MAG: insulinase family protein [Sphingomonas sp.]
MKVRKTLNLCFFMASCALPALAAQAAATRPHRIAPAVATARPDAPDLVERINLPFERFTLPNGLTVIVYPDHSVPKVLVSVTYRVGSKDEPEGKTGFAHLFEHMMFQETENRKGEYFKKLLDDGAIDVNGNTTTDRTRYYEVVPTRELDLALWMESDRMQYLPGAIDLKALDGQRAVVKNEKRQRETPESAARSAAYTAALYPKGHPYDHAPIGSMQDLDNASVADARSWFDNYYGAGNAILLLAGDIDPATAREKVARYFKDVRPGKRVQEIKRWVPVLNEGKKLHFFGKNGTIELERTWPVPTGDEREGTLLQLFASAIAGAPQLALNQALVENDGPALGVSASFGDSTVNGTFSIGIDVKPGADVAEIDRRLDAVLAKLLRDGPDPVVLRQNFAIKDKSLLASLENPQSVGGLLEAGELIAGDPLLFKVGRRWEKEATPAAIAAVARKWLSRPYLAVRTDPEPKTQPAVAGSVDRHQAPVATTATASPRSFPTIERATLSNGARLVVVHRPRLPLVSVALEFATGQMIDHRYPRGLSTYTFGSLFEGSQRYPHGALEAKMRDLGIFPGTGSGDRRCTLSFASDTAGLVAGIDLVAEVLREPLFPQKKIDEYIARVDQSFDAYESNPAGSQSALFNAALWGRDHPYGWIDTRAEAKKVSRDEMLGFYRNELAPANLTAYFVGDITLDKARALLERHLGNWHVDAKPAATIATAPARPTGVRVILIDVPGAEQSNILAGRLIEPWEARRTMAEQLANSALGESFTSRINMNVREDKGWSYGMYSHLGGSVESQRTFYVSGAVQTDNTADAIREIVKEIGSFTHDRPLTATELDGQKTAVLNHMETGLSSNAAYLGAMLDADTRGMPLDYVTGIPDIVRAISLDEARRVAAETFRTDDFVWSISGDLRRIEPAIRALGLGPVEVQDVYGRRLR